MNIVGPARVRRIVREPRRDWVHVCPGYQTPKGRVLAACYTSCPFCGSRRPRG